MYFTIVGTYVLFLTLLLSLLTNYHLDKIQQENKEISLWNELVVNIETQNRDLKDLEQNMILYNPTRVITEGNRRKSNYRRRIEIIDKIIEENKGQIEILEDMKKECIKQLSNSSSSSSSFIYPMKSTTPTRVNIVKMD